MEPHVYRMKRFIQALYCTTGLVFIGMGIFFGRSDLILLLGLLPFTFAPGIYYCCLGLRPRLTLTETAISVRYIFTERSASISDIGSWHTDLHASIVSLLIFRNWSTNYGYYGASGDPYWVLQLRDESGTLRINQNFSVDDAFLDFLSSLKDLNEGEMSIAASDESPAGK